jgi:arylsulfatase A-like enzyme
VRPLRSYLACVIHGALLGAFVGIFCGGLEYLVLFWRQAFSIDVTRAYWDITLGHAVVGLAGGTLAGLAICVLVRRRPAAQYVAWLYTLFIPAVLLAYLAVWATYLLGRPVLKPSNLAAYAGALIAAVLLGLLIKTLGAVLAGRAAGDSVADRFVGLRLAVALGVVAMVLLLGPLFYLERAHAVRAPVRTTWGGVGQQDRPNVLFIVIDATRPDHLPMYGYSRQTAPSLSAFAKQGTTFTRAYAQGSSTRPSIATLFSSMYPAVHQVNFERDFLSDGFTLLPEVLKAAGYTTFAVSSNANVSPTFGYAQGFDQFRVWKTESALRLTILGRVAEDLLGPTRLARLLGERRDIVPTADVITDITLEWIATQSQTPFFLYVHYIDPHFPYRPPAPWGASFDHRKDPARRAGDNDPVAVAAPDRREWLARTLDQYDGEILYADHHVGRLLKSLDDQGVLKNTLVIVTADHGEEFLDHGGIGHGRTAYEEVLRVPLLMRWPGRIPAGTTYDGLVGLIDMMPTILGLVGVEQPPGLQGANMAAPITKTGPAPAERRLFAQVVSDTFRLDATLDARYKLVRHVRGPEAGRDEVYDRERDPLERASLGPESAPALALRRELDTFTRVVTQAASLVRREQAKTLDKDTERALRSLGYIK